MGLLLRDAFIAVIWSWGVGGGTRMFLPICDGRLWVSDRSGNNVVNFVSKPLTRFFRWVFGWRLLLLLHQPVIGCYFQRIWCHGMGQGGTFMHAALSYQS